MSDRVRKRPLSRAARPLLFLVLLSLAAPWLASDQPLWVRGVSRAAWERCEEQLVRALLARDQASFARAREDALRLHLAEGDALHRLLAADEGRVPQELAGFGERDRALVARRPEVLADGAFVALEADRALLDLALEPALRRLPPAEELLAFASRVEAPLPRLGVGAFADAARAVAASAREAASRGERRLTDAAAERSWRALRDGLDRWRAASTSERRALLGAIEPAAPALRSRVALPAFARAARAEVLLWGGLCGFAIAALLGKLSRRRHAALQAGPSDSRRALDEGVEAPRAAAASSSAARVEPSRSLLEQRALRPRSPGVAGSRGRARSGARTAGAAALVLLFALGASAFHAARALEERELDYRGEITSGSFALEGLWMAPVAFGPEAARGEPAELPPCAAEATWRARGGSAPLRDPAPAAGTWRRHPLGTDALGRDVLARVLHGARLSLLIGLFGALAAGAFGIALGVAAGGCGGALDALVRRAIEVLSCFPPLLFALALAAMRGPSATTADAVLGIVYVLVFARWTFLARIARTEVLRLRSEPFVEAARALGVGASRRLVVHVLPHAVPALLVALSAELAAAMVFESALSFLGLGLSEPSASFGGVLRGALQSPSAWWLALFPGLALLAAVLSAHRLGEAFAASRGEP